MTTNNSGGSFRIGITLLLILATVLTGIYLWQNKNTVRPEEAASDTFENCEDIDCNSELVSRPVEAVVGEIETWGLSNKYRTAHSDMPPYYQAIAVFSNEGDRATTSIDADVGLNLVNYEVVGKTQRSRNLREFRHCYLGLKETQSLIDNTSRIFRSAGFSERTIWDTDIARSHMNCAESFIYERGEDYCSMSYGAGDMRIGCVQAAYVQQAKIDASTIRNSFAEYFDIEVANVSDNISTRQIWPSETYGYELIWSYFYKEQHYYSLYRKVGETEWTIVRRGENLKCSTLTAEGKLALKGRISCTDDAGKRIEV